METFKGNECLLIRLKTTIDSILEDPDKVDICSLADDVHTILKVNTENLPESVR